jgi:hypothetical protein
MAKPATRNQFKDYCLRRLGHPVIEINVDDDQVEDRIDDSIQFFQDYHFDGVEKMYMKHRMTAEDITRRWIYCPDSVIFVTGVMPFTDTSGMGMFDIRYQLRLNDLFDFTSVSYVSYEITMQHLRTLELLMVGTPQFRFNRHQNRVMLDIDWTSDVTPGSYVVIECYRALQPDLINLTGTVSGTTTSNVVTGTATTFDQQLLENDFFTLSDGNTAQVNKIISPTVLWAKENLNANITAGTALINGVSDVWNDRFLKQYGTAKIKYQWGSNLSKFAGIQMPGGVTLDGPRIMEEARVEIDKIEEEMQVMNVLPSEIFYG